MSTAVKTQVEIKDRFTGKVLKEVDGAAGEDGTLILRGADLRGAYLTGAYLGGAYLRGAYLTGAYLRGAYLRGAYLRGAYLTGAYLGGADLGGADLGDADLGDADLGGAYHGTVMPDGQTWNRYLSETMPALLRAGGKSLRDFQPHWGCHEWSNCPMAFAFGVASVEDIPLLLRTRAAEFIQFFDGGLISWGAVQAAIDAETRA